MKKEEKIKAFLEHGLQKHSSHMTEKELMVHAGFLVEISFFVAILFSPDLARLAVTQEIDRTSLIIGFTTIWAFLHIFIRIQQRLERWATIHYVGYFFAFNEFCTTEFKDINTEINNNRGKKEENRFIQYILSFIDNIIPIANAPLRSDLKNIKMPIFIVNHIQSQKTFASYYEWLFATLSLIMYGIVLLIIF